PVSLRAWLTPAVPMEREPATLHLEISDDGSLGWAMPTQIDAPHMTLQPLPEQLREETRDGVVAIVHDYRWRVLPLKSESLGIRFGMENGAGLTNYLSGNMEFGDEGLIRKTPVENLDIILAGPVTPNPSELLSSARMEELLNTLSGTYSFVIVDSAPILGMADSVSLSSFVDGVIMVAKFGSTTRDALKGTKRIFDYINAKVLGMIVNGIKVNDMQYGYYSYHYSSYYGRDEDEG
ncbi:MAG: CpsD/CapB family tyrosine-protein kinase, partial [Nitrospiraceae bacterium]|nr:CpsD/CapB family tyrosine-protein kinase [Nitrospiraceae bacterium]